jgi:hypothetical protein
MADNVAVVREAVAAWNTHDRDRLRRHLMRLTARGSWPRGAGDDLLREFV